MAAILGGSGCLSILNSQLFCERRDLSWRRTHRAEAVWLLWPPSLHLLAGFCQSFSTSRPLLYLPGWPYNPWFLVRASGLLLGGGQISGKKTKVWEQHPKRTSPFECVRERGLKLSKATSFLTTASKRDGVRSSARGSDTRSRGRKIKKKSFAPLNRLNNARNEHKARGFHSQSLEFISPKTVLSGRSARLSTNWHCTTSKRRQRAGHEVVSSCVVQLLEKPARTVSSPPSQSYETTVHETSSFLFLLLLLLFQPLRNVFCVDELMSSGPAHSSLSALRFIITFKATPDPKPPWSSPLSDKQRRQRRHLPTLKAVQCKTPTRAASWEM